MNLAPLNGVSKGWRQLIVQPNGEIDRHTYTFCTLERLCEGLRRRDLFVSPKSAIYSAWYDSARQCNAGGVEPNCYGVG